MIEKTLMSRGFTILELLLVIGLLTVLVALTLPVGLRFYQLQVVDETADSVTSLLVNAKMEARLGKHDRDHGVKFLPNLLVVFEGDSYVLRVTSEDQPFPLPPGTILSGMSSDEIRFAKVTGSPSATGTLSLSLYGETRNLTIREYNIYAE